MKVKVDKARRVRLQKPALSRPTLAKMAPGLLVYTGKVFLRFDVVRAVEEDREERILKLSRKKGYGFF